jgi:FdhD protein
VKASTRRPILRVEAHGVFEDADALALEEPLEVRVAPAGEAPVRVAVTMRTPGHDEELAVGFLFGEGLLGGRDDLLVGAGSRSSAGTSGDVLELGLRGAFDRSLLDRSFYVSSSCGVCGKAALDFVEREVPPLPAGPTVTAAALLGMPASLRAAQVAFERTGGLHATGRFDPSGRVLTVREDVGRHNAMDKIVGRALLDGELPLRDSVLVVSGRVSFELVQKAAMAGAPILAAVSAPSSLAAALADRVGMTLVGFLRGGRFNVYTHAARIVTS